MQGAVGSDTIRTEAWDKVTGAIRYNDDEKSPACLHARLLTSTFAHARIVAVDTSEACGTEGVRAVVTGDGCDVRTGSIIQDMPVLARNKVRYYGEPVAIAVADEEWQAALAVQRIRVRYEPLAVVDSPSRALAGGAAVIHENLGEYKKTVEEVSPRQGSNEAHRVQIRKGSMDKGWAQSRIIAEGRYTLPQAGHVFMEPRNARAEIRPDGTVYIDTSSQASHAVRKLLSQYFRISENKIVVRTSFLGGGFGGKVNPHPEMMAYIASRAVGGKKVRLALTREESFIASACKIGAEMTVKLGAAEDGRLTAMEAQFLIDTGGYADTGPQMAKAAAANCTGAYNIENVSCDSLCVYTNHIYATSFRGFGHDVSTFAVERTLDKLAAKLRIDPLELRLKNAVAEGHTTPTQQKVTLANTGNLSACIGRLRTVMNWDEGTRVQIGANKVRARGMACFSKTSSSPTDASSGAVITFCSDGSVNLNCSAVECGPGMLTAMQQLLADRLMIGVERISVNGDIDTRVCPEHWKTVASMTTYMVGKAVLDAADDAIRQMRKMAAIALRCAPEDVEHGPEKMYLKEDPSAFIAFKDLVYGVKYPDGNAVGGQVIGRGSFIMKHLTKLDPATGKGRTGPHWTVGAQAVEIEYDSRECAYRLIKAATVLDAGKVINPYHARGQVMGAMNMGLSLATREHFVYDGDCRLNNSSLRTYKVLHCGQNPAYVAEFIETPNPDAPCGARGLAEEAVLGMPPALANALSQAAGIEFDTVPVTFESIWSAKHKGAT